MKNAFSPAEIAPKVHYVSSPHELPAAQSWPDRVFSDWQLQLVMAGGIRYDFKSPARSFTAMPGEIVLAPPGVRLSQTLIAPPPRNRFFCVHFLFGEGTRQGMTPAVPERSALRDPELFAGMFERLYDSCCSPGCYHDMIASGLVREMLLRLLLPETSGRARPEPVMQMTGYLDEHLAEHPGRRELARRFHLSPEYVNQLFLRELGLSPGEYVRRQLTRRAYRMLSGGGMSVKEVAEALGFCNPFYFSRVFKDIYGVSPSQCASGRKI